MFWRLLTLLLIHSQAEGQCQQERDSQPILRFLPVALTEPWVRKKTPTQSVTGLFLLAPASELIPRWDLQKVRGEKCTMRNDVQVFKSYTCTDQAYLPVFFHKWFQLPSNLESRSSVLPPLCQGLPTPCFLAWPWNLPLFLLLNPHVEHGEADRKPSARTTF